MKLGIGTVAILLLVTAVVSWGLARPSLSLAPGGDAAGEVLARVGGVEITRQEVEEIAPDQFIQAKHRIHDLVDRSLTQAINRKLVDLEAERRGITVDSLLALEITGKAEAPSETAIDSIYRIYQAQLELPLDSVRPQIISALTQQRQSSVRGDFFDELRARYQIENLLEPERVEVEPDGPAKGPEDAPVTIVEFSDFECPFCYRILPTLARIEQKYGDQVRIVYRHFPLNSIHPHAQITAEASMCADEQGRFWEMHDAIFEVRGRADEADLSRMAGELGLETGAFDECLSSHRYRDKVVTDLRAGRKAGVTGTPALFINGRFLSGAQAFPVVERIIDDELARG